VKRQQEYKQGKNNQKQNDEGVRPGVKATPKGKKNGNPEQMPG